MARNGCKTAIYLLQILKPVSLSKGVLVVGAGGLGCPAIQFMAAAGLSPIGVVDYDTVDLSNLHRQILHTEQKKVSKVHVLKSSTFVLTV